jgi:GNAT superfamily N-acetyltransferase
MPQTWRRGRYVISTDRSLLDFETIHAFLATSYWSPGIPRKVVEDAAHHALPFGVYTDADASLQVGYARILTDYAAMAYVLDVFILEAYRRQGLARWLMEVMLAHPDLQQVRTWLLVTRDAHGLYEKLGFTQVKDSHGYMRRSVPAAWMTAV